MISTRSRLTLIAGSLLLVTLCVTFAEKLNSAKADAPIDPSCTSSLPCIEYDNNGDGPGIRGISVRGNGLAGATKVNSTSAATGREGLIGNDISTSGIFNAGVRGISVRGTGVAGQSSINTGVAGHSTSGNGVSGQSSSGPGVFGTTNSGNGVTGNSNSGIGVSGISMSGAGMSGFSASGFGVNGITNGSGAVAGVQGSNNASTIAVRANGFGGPLFVANNHSGVDVFTVDNGGNLNLTGTQSIGGDLTSAGGVGIGGIVNTNTSLSVGLGTARNFGIVASGDIAGVVGETANGTATAVQAVGGGGLIYEGIGTGLVDVFKVDDAGNVHAHSFTADLAAASGQKLGSYSPQASEPVIEDFGEGQLINGSAYVRIEPRFASTMARGNYLVFITPQGDNRGLYVTQKSPEGFAVRESQGGHSSLAFDYRLVAKPLGVQQPRLPLLTAPRVPRLVPPMQRLVMPPLHVAPKVRPQTPR